MPRRTRSHRRTASRPIAAILVWSVVGILAVGMVTSYVLLRTEPRDPVSLCPAIGPKGFIAVLIDVSDPLTPPQEAKLDRLLTSQASPLLVPDHLLDVYVMSEAGEKPIQLMSLCHPGTWTQASTVEKLNKNARLFKLEYDKFIQKIDDLKTAVLNKPPYRTSPIAETVDYITAASFQDANDRDTTLIVVSDMLQNSPRYSVYTGTEMAKDQALPGHMSYQGKTYIYQLASDRDSRLQTGRLVDVWNHKISRAGSRILVWEKW